MRVRTGLIGLAVALLIGVTVSVAATTVASNKRAARRDAPRLLHRLVLPPGAQSAASDPAAGGRLRQPGSFPVTPALVDVHRFWRVLGDPGAIESWFRQHAPSGSTVVGWGTGGGPGYVLDTVDFGFHPRPGVLGSRDIIVSVTEARGGGTAIRADAEVVWFVPRPPSEQIPAATRLIDVTVNRLNASSPSLLTVTDAATVKKIVRLINALPPAQPGVEACPADVGPEITLDFLAGAGEQPLATVTADGSGCGTVTFTLHGRPEPNLADGSQLVSKLEHLLGLKG